MCGCGGQSTSMVYAKAVLCLTCPHAQRKDPWWWIRWLYPAYGIVNGIDAIECKVSGKPTPLHIGGEPCPKGRFRMLGTSRWWMGVPYPLRVCAILMGADSRKIDRLPGCGCIRPLKLAWEGFWGRVMRW